MFHQPILLIWVDDKHLTCWYLSISLTVSQFDTSEVNLDQIVALFIDNSTEMVYDRSVPADW